MGIWWEEVPKSGCNNREGTLVHLYGHYNGCTLYNYDYYVLFLKIYYSENIIFFQWN